MNKAKITYIMVVGGVVAISPALLLDLKMPYLLLSMVWYLPVYAWGIWWLLWGCKRRAVVR